MTVDKDWKINFLTDEPAEEDDGKAHQAIANAILKIVRTPDMKSCGIALLGDYGTGKSTVVRLIKKAVDGASNSARTDTEVSSAKETTDTAKGQKDCTVAPTPGGEKTVSLLPLDRVKIVVFDAWAHQGDPLRRAFLRIVRDQLNLESMGVKSEALEDLTRKFQIVEGTRKREDETLEPRYNWGGLFFVVLVLYISIRLLQPTKDENGIISDPIGIWTTYFGVGQQGATFILFVGFVVLVGWSVNSAVKRCKKDSSAKFLEQLNARLSSLLFAKVPTGTRKEWTGTRDATSIEFQEYFTSLMKALTSELKEEAAKPYQILIAIDNLDRLPKEQLEAAWLALAPIISDAESDGPPVSGLWPILSSSPLRKPDGDTKTNQALDIEKHFQISISVPALQTAEWQKYFDTQATKLFGSDSAVDVQEVRRIFTYLKSSNDLSRRTIVRYLNDLGAMLLTLEEDIPLRFVAMHVAADHGLDQKVRNGVSPEPLNSIFAGTGPHDPLSALYYGCTIKDAPTVRNRNVVMEATKALRSDSCLPFVHDSAFREVLLAEYNIGITENLNSHRTRGIVKLVGELLHSIEDVGFLNSLKARDANMATVLWDAEMYKSALGFSLVPGIEAAEGIAKQLAYAVAQRTQQTELGPLSDHEFNLLLSLLKKICTPTRNTMVLQPEQPDRQFWVTEAQDLLAHSELRAREEIKVQNGLFQRWKGT